MANQSLKDQWKRKINSWEASGLTQSEFCRKHNLTTHQFGYWRTKLLKEKSENESSGNLFLPVKTSTTFSISIADIKISFDRAPEPQWMASFIKSFQVSHAQS